MPAQPIHPDTIAAMTEQLLGMQLSPADRERVAGLLNAITADMQAMHAMEVGHREPATVYEAFEDEKRSA